MDGLGRIIEQIAAESASEYEEILENARIECENIWQAGKEKANKQRIEILDESKRLVAQTLASSKRRGETEGKARLQNARNTLINDVISEALNQLHTRTDEEYTVVLSALLNKYAHTQAGELLISDTDLNRMTTGFHEAAKQHELEIVVSDISVGGFILRYGKKEENCMFTALLSGKLDKIRDKAYKTLFG